MSLQTTVIPKLKWLSTQDQKLIFWSSWIWQFFLSIFYIISERDSVLNQSKFMLASCMERALESIQSYPSAIHQVMSYFAIINWPNMTSSLTNYVRSKSIFAPSFKVLYISALNLQNSPFIRSRSYDTYEISVWSWSVLKPFIVGCFVK